jgi:hypothetical protein
MRSRSRPRTPCHDAISSPTPPPKRSSIEPSHCLGCHLALFGTPPPLIKHLALWSHRQCSSIPAPCFMPPWPPPLSCSRVKPPFTSAAPMLSPSSTAATFSAAPDVGGRGVELQPSHHCRARVLTVEAHHCCITMPRSHHRRLSELP